MIAHKKTNELESADEHPNPRGNQSPAECEGSRDQVPERENITGAAETPCAELTQDENGENDNQPKGTIVNKRSLSQRQVCVKHLSLSKNHGSKSRSFSYLN